MGLFNKFKNVLFEETEVDIPVISKEDEKIESEKPKVESTVVEKKVPPVVKEVPLVKEEPIKPEVITPSVSKTREIDDFKSEPTFEFPVFDESDFSNTIRERTNSRNILEHEKIAKTKRFDKKVEDKDVPDGNAFKPSPIISPVYGILDQNYKKEDIVPKKSEEGFKSSSRNKNDIDSIRNKAYGTLEDDIEGLIPEEEDKIEEIEPSKTIDELIKESDDEEMDITIDIDEIPIPNRKTKAKKEDLDKALSALDDFEEDLERSRSSKERLESDTLETDLFNLIDSMYENKEEGEE